MKEFLFIANYLTAVDESPFTFTLYHKPELRYSFLMQCIEAQVLGYAQTHIPADQITPDSLFIRFNQCLDVINERFWNNTWPCHEVHFHKSFKEYANCPFTCVTELQQLFEKLARGA